MNALRDALRLPQVLAKHRELLGAFVRRELRARIEGSILGRMWPIIQPVVLFAIYYLVFAQILKIGFSDDLAPHEPERVGWRSTFYLITGILPWTALAESLTRGSSVVLENANLIKKIAFPSELLPVYSTVVFHVYFLVGFVILLVLELAVNGSLPAALAWLPLIVLAQFLFVNGIAMFLSAANIFVRDVSQAVPVAVTFWMFTTPVFYDLAAISKGQEAAVAVAAAQVENAERALAESADPGAAQRLQASIEEARLAETKVRDTQVLVGRTVGLMKLNPMATLLDLYRSIFSYGKVAFPIGRLFGFLGIGAVVQVLAYAFFLRSKGRFADEV